MKKIPVVIVKTEDGEKTLDLYSRLLKDRIIFLTGAINEQSADMLIAQMMYLSLDDPEKDILFVINSPGGSVSATLAIYDTMQFIKPDVSTICTGLAASGGALLLAAGTKGKRLAMPNSRVMIHQPLGGAQGDAINIQIQAKEILKTKKHLNQMLADFTSRTLAEIEEATDRDRWFSAKEGVDFGLVDGLTGSIEDLVK